MQSPDCKLYRILTPKKDNLRSTRSGNIFSLSKKHYDDSFLPFSRNGLRIIPANYMEMACDVGSVISLVVKISVRVGIISFIIKASVSIYINYIIL